MDDDVDESHEVAGIGNCLATVRLGRDEDGEKNAGKPSEEFALSSELLQRQRRFI